MDDWRSDLPGGLSLPVWLAWRIAQGRGHEKGFAWGFWLGVPGLIVVACRPVQEQPPLAKTPETRWMCLQCGARNPAGAAFCQSCGKSRQEKPEKWVCAGCQARNRAENSSCFACGKAR